MDRKLARPERFELPTRKFAVWCSIRLRYGRWAPGIRRLPMLLRTALRRAILSGRVKDGEKVKISATKFGLTFNGKVAAAA
jgi:hypothetical protein